MALKPVYKDTRGDRNRLIRDVRPGDLLYVIHDVADRYVLGRGPHGYDDPQLYSEYIVVRDKAPLTGTPMVRSTSNGGLQSVTQLLAHEREVLTVEPAHLRHIAVDPANKGNASGHARAVTAALEVGGNGRKEKAGAGAKRGWW